VLANLFDFAVAAVLLSGLLAAAGIGLSIHIVWVPVLLGVLVVITVAAALLLSCANLFFRDVRYLVEVFLTFGIFFTPVLYDADAMGSWATLLRANPVGSLLEALDDVVVGRVGPDLWWVGYATAWAVVSFAVASTIFQHAETTFAERV
jgi:ABC-type polysaccharide/polyol phosphate export permease